MGCVRTQRQANIHDRQPERLCFRMHLIDKCLWRAANDFQNTNLKIFDLRFS